MRRQLQQLIAQIGGHLSERAFLKLFALVLIVVLYGVVSERELFWFLSLAVCARGLYLAHDFLRHGNGVERPRRELFFEGMGLVTFGILVPADVALYTSQIVSLRSGQGWPAIFLVFVCAVLYALPFICARFLSFSSEARMAWWSIPLLPAVYFLYMGIATRHEYLNPFNPEHEKLAANHVLSLHDAVIARRDVEWIFRYARSLDRNGDVLSAMRYYREGLRVDPNRSEVRQRLSELSSATGLGQVSIDLRAKEDARKPLWNDGEVLPDLDRCELDVRLQSVPRTTVVVVSLGEVRAGIVNAVGYAIKSELDMPVCAVPTPIPLPSSTRTRGVLGGPQWSVDALLAGYSTHVSRIHPSFRAPVRYLLLTEVDMYGSDANFLFSTSVLGWGAVVSTARFGSSGQKEALVNLRTAKQSISAVMQVFGVPKSLDPNCVTSYTHSLDEFDAKGNRPNSDSLAAFRRIVDPLDQKLSDSRRTNP